MCRIYCLVRVSPCTAGSGAGLIKRPATFSLVRGSAACQRAFHLGVPSAPDFGAVGSKSRGAVMPGVGMMECNREVPDALASWRGWVQSSALVCALEACTMPEAERGICVPSQARLDDLKPKVCLLDPSIALQLCRAFFYSPTLVLFKNEKSSEADHGPSCLLQR